MVFLAIVIQKNGETVFLDQLIPQVDFMKLISCGLYNSWDTLKNEGTLSIVESDNSVKFSEIPPGHYTLEAVAKQMEESLKTHIYEISADAYSPLGQLIITNHGRKTLKFDPYLSNRPHSINQYSSMASRLSGQNCKFFKFLLSSNSQKRLRYKENNTKYRSSTRKPRSHVRILIY